VAILSIIYLSSLSTRAINTAYAFWYAPNILAYGAVVFLILFNLKNKPIQNNDSIKMFCIVLTSLLLPNLTPYIGSLYTIYKNEPINILRNSAILINFFSMLFYVYAVYSLGRGLTVLPEAHILRTGGVYSISRHPLYLTYILWYITQNLIYQSWMVLLLSAVQIALILYRAKCEEKVLSSVFPDYTAYKNNVMWLGWRRKVNTACK